eukprot:4249436-Prymnesium_polylepis.1
MRFRRRELYKSTAWVKTDDQGNVSVNGHYVRAITAAEWQQAALVSRVVFIQDPTQTSLNLPKRCILRCDDPMTAGFFTVKQLLQALREHEFRGGPHFTCPHTRYHGMFAHEWAGGEGDWQLRKVGSHPAGLALPLFELRWEVEFECPADDFCNSGDGKSGNKSTATKAPRDCPKLVSRGRRMK